MPIPLFVFIVLLNSVVPCGCFVIRTEAALLSVRVLVVAGISLSGWLAVAPLHQTRYEFCWRKLGIQFPLCGALRFIIWQRSQRCLPHSSTLTHWLLLPYVRIANCNDYSHFLEENLISILPRAEREIGVLEQNLWLSTINECDCLFVVVTEAIGAEILMDSPSPISSIDTVEPLCLLLQSVVVLNFRFE